MKFKVPPPVGLEPGSPFGPDLRALVHNLASGPEQIPIVGCGHVFGLERGGTVTAPGRDQQLESIKLSAQQGLRGAHFSDSWR